MRFDRVFPAVATVLAVPLLLYALWLGIGISEDTVSYISASRSLQDSGTMRDIDDSYFVAWAPLYPFVVTLMEAFPSKYDNPVGLGLGWFNMCLFALTAISSWALIEKAIEKRFFKATCLLFIIFSFTIMQVHLVALTEAPFLLLINLVLLYLTKDKPQIIDHLTLGILCALALSLRYAGVFLLPIVLFSFWQRKKEKNALGKVAVFLVVAFTPILIWLVRNWMLTGTLTGFRPSGDALFLKNIAVLADTITSWIFPIKIPLLLRIAGLIILFVLLRKTFLQKKIRMHLLLIASYLLFLVVAYFFFSFEEPRDRLLAPVFISFSILLFSGLDQLANRFSSSFPLVAGAVCLWMFYPAVRIVKHVQMWHDEGVEVYNKDHWKNSQTIKWLEQNPIGKRIFSNDAYAVYYFRGKHAFRVPKSFYSYNQFNESVRDGDYLVWWKGREYYDLKLIEADYSLTQEKELDDAIIFRMNKSHE